jgi:hypothetical protein
MIAQQKEIATASRSTTSPDLPVMVVLGNPKNPDCSQHGICRIYEAGNPHEACTCLHQTFAWLSATETGTVRIRFDLNFLNQNSLQYFFEQDHFLVPTPYIFPESLLGKLNFPRTEASIPAGKHPILRHPEWLELAFEC